MNSNKLLSVLRDTRLLKFVSVEELQQLTNDYPYFQQAHILLAKKYLLDNNQRFEEKLHTAAIYASDRTNLRTIMLGIETQETEETQPVSLQEKEIIQKVSRLEIPSETAIEKDTINNDLVAAADELSHASISDMLPPNDNLLEEENDELLTEEDVATEATVIEELQVAALPTDASTEDELSHASMSDTLPPQNALLEEENYEELAEDNTITEATAVEELESVAAEPLQSTGKPADENFNVNQPHTFSDWLKFIQNSPRALLNTSSAPDYHPISVPEPLTEPHKTEDTFVPIEHTADILVAEPADNLQAIDEFVAETAITTEVVKVIPIKELADKSVEENDELLTETLARVYEEQGLYNKAIRIYAKLSLKFPQKSVYFASLIKELKSKL